MQRLKILQGICQKRRYNVAYITKYEKKKRNDMQTCTMEMAAYITKWTYRGRTFFLQTEHELSKLSIAYDVDKE